MPYPDRYELSPDEIAYMNSPEEISLPTYREYIPRTDADQYSTALAQGPYQADTSIPYGATPTRSESVNSHSTFTPLPPPTLQGQQEFSRDTSLSQMKQEGFGAALAQPQGQGQGTTFQDVYPGNYTGKVAGMDAQDILPAAKPYSPTPEKAAYESQFGLGPGVGRFGDALYAAAISGTSAWRNGGIADPRDLMNARKANYDIIEQKQRGELRKLEGFEKVMSLDMSNPISQSAAKGFFKSLGVTDTGIVNAFIKDAQLNGATTAKTIAELFKTGKFSGDSTTIAQLLQSKNGYELLGTISEATQKQRALDKERQDDLDFDQRTGLRQPSGTGQGIGAGTDPLLQGPPVPPELRGPGEGYAPSAPSAPIAPQAPAPQQGQPTAPVAPIPQGTNQKITINTSMVEGKKLGFSPKEQTRFMGILGQESAWGTHLIGDKGHAHGPGQVHQGALDEVNTKLGTKWTLQDLHNPEIGTRVAANYFRILLDRSGGDLDKATYNYNGGGDPNYQRNVARREGQAPVSPQQQPAPAAQGLQQGTATHFIPQEGRFTLPEGTNKKEEGELKQLAIKRMDLRGKVEVALAESVRATTPRIRQRAENLVKQAEFAFEQNEKRIKEIEEPIRLRQGQAYKQGLEDTSQIAKEQRSPEVKAAEKTAEISATQAGHETQKISTKDAYQYEQDRQQRVAIAEASGDQKAIAAAKSIPRISGQLTNEQFDTIQQEHNLRPLDKLPPSTKEDSPLGTLTNRVKTAKDLGEAIELYEKVSTGVWNDAIRDKLSSWGITQLNGDEATAKAILLDIMLSKRHQISGAAFGAKEAADILATVPHLGLPREALLAMTQRYLSAGERQHSLEVNALDQSGYLVPKGVLSYPKIKVPAQTPPAASGAPTTGAPSPKANAFLKGLPGH